MDCYVYYRVKSESEHEFATQFQQLRERYGVQTGVYPALNRRPDEKDGLHTWMEVYRRVPPGFEQALDSLIAETSLAQFISGERHHEYFMEIAPCA